MKTPEQQHSRRYGVFIANFDEYISHNLPVFLLLILMKLTLVGSCYYYEFLTAHAEIVRRKNVSPRFAKQYL